MKDKESTLQIKVSKDYNDDVDIVESARKNIIRYALETFIRAFPDMRDGLKPIHRRILYTMLENRNFGYTKVASITGAVLGKYHPHGDMAVNDALVRMGQPWVMNYTYIDGQGNYGTQDGDGAAAGRYIEAKLSDFAKKAVLDDIDPVSVNYEDNYTFTLKIPEYLTSRIPLLLINGVAGIGEAFRVSIPPHNLNDVADLCIRYVKNKSITNVDLCNGFFPDFPTGGEIINGAEVERFYRYGDPVTISLRGCADLLTDSNTIVIKEFPYGIDSDDIGISVADGIRSGNMILSGITNIQDENNNVDDDGSSFEAGDSKKKKKKKTYEYICKKDANMIEILNEMYKTTSLKTGIVMSFMINDKGIPFYANVLDIIKYWYATRIDCKRRKHTNAIAQIHSKRHILEGILTVYSKMDDVIDVIRKNASDKDTLIRALHDKFGLTVVQAKGIYEISLGSLSKFGKSDLESTIARLSTTIDENEYALTHIDETIVAELEELKELFGRPRRTKVIMSVEEFKNKSLVLSRGSFVYAKNAIGLYDVNGVKDSKNITTGLKAVKIEGKNVRDIIGGKLLQGKTPIAFIVCYENGGINRIDASVFRTINVWFDVGSESFITCATPIYTENDEIVCVSSDNKLKRISVSDVPGKRVLSTGSTIKEMVCYSDPDGKPDENGLLLVAKDGTYNFSPIDDIPLLGRGAGGVKSAFDENVETIFGIIVPREFYETERLMLSSIDTRDGQNYMHGLIPSELRLSGRTGKPKLIGIPEKYSVTSIALMDISDKESQICMVGKSSTSTLNLFNNFRKANEAKRLFLTVTSSTQI